MHLNKFPTSKFCFQDGVKNQPKNVRYYQCIAWVCTCFCLLASELVTKTTSYNGLMLTACGRQQKYLKIKNAVFLIYIHLYVQRCDLVRWRKKGRFRLQNLVICSLYLLIYISCFNWCIIFVLQRRWCLVWRSLCSTAGGRPPFPSPSPNRPMGWNQRYNQKA